MDRYIDLRTVLAVSRRDAYVSVCLYMYWAQGRVADLHVEYVERRTKYGILFICSLFCKCTHLEYIRIHVLCRVNQAEYAIRIPTAAPQEYVNIYSTRRVAEACAALTTVRVTVEHSTSDGAFEAGGGGGAPAGGAQ